MRKRQNKETCPLCGNTYTKKHHETKHHLLPKWWYKDERTVSVCRVCHNDFNTQYPMKNGEKWSPLECLENWFGFCQTKGKEAIEIYPELKKFHD